MKNAILWSHGGHRHSHRREIPDALRGFERNHPPSLGGGGSPKLGARGREHGGPGHRAFPDDRLRRTVGTCVRTDQERSGTGRSRTGPTDPGPWRRTQEAGRKGRRASAGS